MATTIVYDDQASDVEGAEAAGDNLWLPLGALTASSGWEIKPEGACQGEICVPLPANRADEFLRHEPERFNLAALARLLDRPLVHDGAHDAWVFGESARARQEALTSLEAPDFTLPDLDGTMHSLSEQRGKKVFLVSWASW